MSLSKSADVAQPSITANPLPFTQEADALLVDTWVRVGEPPLRFFKNDYDKPPVSYVPKRPSCIISSDETWKIIEEKGWNRLDARTYHAKASQNAQACPADMDSKLVESFRPDYSESELLAKICSGED